jgi:hypothetical protein
VLAIETVSVTQTGPGYTEDPYDTPGERAEGFFVGKIANFFLSRMGLSEPDGFCSTSREWHIMLAGITAGLKAGTLSAVPECPPKWTDEKQYWDMPAMIANVLKCQWPSVVVLVGGFFTLKQAGITLPGVL